MANKVISTYTLSTTWRTSTTACFLYQNGDSTYFKGELAGFVSSVSSQISTIQTDISAKANVAQSTWILVTYSSNWVDYSTTMPPTSYFKDTLGFIHFRLGCKSGASNPICNLPAGYRPEYTLTYPIYTPLASSSVTSAIQIESDGDINAINHINVYLHLGEIIFTPST